MSLSPRQASTCVPEASGPPDFCLGSRALTGLWLPMTHVLGPLPSLWGHLLGSVHPEWTGGGLLTGRAVRTPTMEHWFLREGPV